jgi:hypothetical protein
MRRLHSFEWALNEAWDSSGELIIEKITSWISVNPRKQDALHSIKCGLVKTRDGSSEPIHVEIASAMSNEREEALHSIKRALFKMWDSSSELIHVEIALTMSNERKEALHCRERGLVKIRDGSSELIAA